MNIFFVSDDPIKLAAAVCDRHLMNSIYWTTRILATARWKLLGQSPYPEAVYVERRKRSRHVLWVASSLATYEWTVKLFEALLLEYHHRFQAQHANGEMLSAFRVAPKNLATEIGFTPPPQVLPQDFEHEDTVTAYRRFYATEKRGVAKWTNRRPPLWWNDRRYKRR